jgi:hypothetical protein
MRRTLHQASKARPKESILSTAKSEARVYTSIAMVGYLSDSIP